MNRFVQNENVVKLRQLIAIAEDDPSRDEVRYQLLSLLVAEEEANPRSCWMDSSLPPRAEEIGHA